MLHLTLCRKICAPAPAPPFSWNISLLHSVCSHLIGFFQQRIILSSTVSCIGCSYYYIYILLLRFSPSEVIFKIILILRKYSPQLNKQFIYSSGQKVGLGSWDLILFANGLYCSFIYLFIFIYLLYLYILISLLQLPALEEREIVFVYFQGF